VKEISLKGLLYATVNMYIFVGEMPEIVSSELIDPQRSIFIVFLAFNEYFDRASNSSLHCFCLLAESYETILPY